MPAGSRQLSRRTTTVRSGGLGSRRDVLLREARCTPRRGPPDPRIHRGKSVLVEPERRSRNERLPLVKSARFGEKLKRPRLALMSDSGPESFNWEEIGMQLLHPTQIVIIEVMSGLELAISPRLLEQLSPDSGITLGHFAYHCKRLAQLGILEKVGSVPRRGAAENYYFFATDSERETSFYYFLQEADREDR